MSIGWFIGLASASVIFFVFSFISSRVNFKNRFKNNYDVRDYFPYEFNFESPFSMNILGNVTLLMSLALSIACFALTAAKIQTNGYVLYSLIAGALYSILVGVIHFVPLKTLKTHLAFSVLLLGIAFVTPAAIGLGGFAVYQQTKGIYPLIIFIVCMVVAVFYFGLAMNPKLTMNFKLIVQTDEKGNEYYVRPKFIMMAFSEWLDIFGLYLSQLLLLLLMIAIL